jgi:hypothetical protein
MVACSYISSKEKNVMNLPYLCYVYLLLLSYSITSLKNLEKIESNLVRVDWTGLDKLEIAMHRRKQE